MEVLHLTIQETSSTSSYKQSNQKQKKYELDDFLLEPIFIIDENFKKLEKNSKPTKKLINLLNEY